MTNCGTHYKYSLQGIHTYSCSIVPPFTASTSHHLGIHHFIDGISRPLVTCQPPVNARPTNLVSCVGPMNQCLRHIASESLDL